MDKFRKDMLVMMTGATLLCVAFSTAGCVVARREGEPRAGDLFSVGARHTSVYVDPDTGCNYIVGQSASSITPRLDLQGNPGYGCKEGGRL